MLNRWRRSAALVVAGVVAVTIVLAGAPGAQPASAALGPPVDIFVPTAGPLGPVTVIGDSIMMGGGLFAPNLPTRLVEQGWGPVRLRAGGGYSTGIFNVELAFRSSYWITLWRSQGWDAPNVIVNLGANDSGFCNVDLACARAAIIHLVDAIGPGHKIWWPQITRLYTHQGQQNNWNLALRQIADERADFFTWDWPTVMATLGIPSGDGTHLGPDGYRLRSSLMAEQFTSDVAVATRVGGDAPLPSAIGAASEYQPLAPARVFDTRSDAPGRQAAGNVLTLDLSDDLPAGATAVAVNLTATRAAADGYLTAYPCNRARRDVSSLNYPAGIDRGALAVLPVAPDGRLCIFTSADADIVVDLQGAFVPDAARFTPRSPTRLADTRATGRTSVLEVPAAAGATGLALNITATNAGASGFLTAYPCGPTRPEVSSVNFGVGDTIAGAAFVPVGAGRKVCVYASGPVDVIVDMTGTFTATGGLRFVAADPRRVYDTRSGVGGWAPIQGRNQMVDVRVVPPGAAAVTGTLTMVGPLTSGFLTAFGCATVPPTSNVNADKSRVLANAVTVGVSATGRMCVSSSATSHVLFDTTGWWVA